MLMTLGLAGCLMCSSATVPAPKSSTADSAAQSLVAASPSSQEVLASAGPALLPESLRPKIAERSWKYLVLHHSATENGDVASIDAAHRQRKDSAGKPWLGIAYHFVIGNGNGMADGLIEPTFRWLDQIHGAHAGDRPHNDHGIGICLIGNFEDHPPTPRQVASAKELIAKLAARYSISTQDVLPHSQIVATECPGKQFPLATLVDAASDESKIRTAAVEQPPSPER